MATVSPISSPWIPEDDLLLKNAVEAGASLEALAKGAVQFSRRFTFRELRDRWHSLLYDPDISAQACARMVELENSGSNPSLKFNRLKGNGTDPEKRKSGSIRREYYAMRKRIRSELFNSSDLGFLPEPDLHDCGDHGVDFQEHLTLDNEPRCISNTFELQETDLDILRQAFPETLEGFTATDGVNNNDNHQNIYGFHEQKDAACMSENNVELLPNQNLFETEASQAKSLPAFGPMTNNNLIQQFNSPDSEDNPSCHMMGFSPLPRLPLWKTMEDISAPAMPVTGENVDTTNVVESTSEVPEGVDPACESPPPFDGIHPENPSFIHPTGISEGDFVDISDSLLNFGNDDGLLFMDVDENEKDSVEKSCYDHLHSILLSSPNDLQENELQNIEPELSVAPITEPEETGQTVPVDELATGVHHAEVSVPSASEEICCVLNSEDTEIPCNDDIFLLIHPDRSFAASAKQPIVADSVEALSSSADEDCEQGLKLMKGNVAGFLPEKVPGRSLAGRAVRPELTGHSKKGLRDYNQQRSTYVNAISTTDGLLKEDIPKAELRTSDNQITFRGITSNAEPSSSIPESSVKPSLSDQDEPQSDDDVPYFSDIEAMILEMDLGPYDEEPYINKKVSKYQLEDSKRRIIRLEQCARTALQRAMTSQGALAVLYGRHLKHYIRKTEVVLGRSTEDVDVDVDLRKEGRANKISRRQAIIKMETNGSFSLKNLGKSSISVNGKSVATGHLLTLTSSCLIEIRGMSFVFEINHKYVRRCLENNAITEKNQGKMSKFEWAPEGKP